MKCLFLFIAFGCLGFAVEIFFTAFSDLYIAFKNGEKMNPALVGKSYVWMFLIYGSAGALFYSFFDLIDQWPFLVRLLFYVVCIYTIEYLTGWGLDKAIGRCPWEYTTGWHLHGYIRLDYAPFWLIFGALIEYVYVFLDQHLVI